MALSKIRKQVHIGMAVVMGAVIFVFNLLNNTSVIDAIYTLASHTYGPILGLFAFGIFTKKQVYDKIYSVGSYRFSYSLLYPATKFGSMVQQLPN